MAKDSCLSRMAAGAAVGGAVGCAVGSSLSPQTLFAFPHLGISDFSLFGLFSMFIRKFNGYWILAMNWMQPLFVFGVLSYYVMLVLLNEARIIVLLERIINTKNIKVEDVFLCFCPVGHQAFVLYPQKYSFLCEGRQNFNFPFIL